MKKTTKLLAEILKDEYDAGRKNDIDARSDEDKVPKLLVSLLKTLRKDAQMGRQLHAHELRLLCEDNLDDIEAEIRHPEDGYPYHEYYDVGEEMYKSLLDLGWTPPLK